MDSFALRRIKREILSAQTEVPTSDVTIEVKDCNYMMLEGEIFGPPDTPYEGGRFKLDISIPDMYPFVPPKIKFITKIWHPNISSATGVICLDILKDKWAAALTLQKVLLSIQVLLSSAEPDEPQDAVVAKQYLENYELFLLTAKEWTHIYAGAPQRNPEFEMKLERIVEMGVTQSKALFALSISNWDVEESMKFIFS